MLRSVEPSKAEAHQMNLRAARDRQREAAENILEANILGVVCLCFGDFLPPTGVLEQFIGGRGRA